MAVDRAIHRYLAIQSTKKNVAKFVLGSFQLLSSGGFRTSVVLQAGSPLTRTAFVTLMLDLIWMPSVGTSDYYIQVEIRY